MVMITTKEAARRLSVTQQTIRRLVHAGKLKAILLNSGNQERPQIRVDEDALNQFIEDSVIKPSDPNNELLLDNAHDSISV